MKISVWTVEEIAPPKLTYNRDGSVSGRREFRCAWNDADDIVAFLMPSSFVPNTGSVAVLPGASWPGKPGLLVSTVDLEGFDSEYPSTEDLAGVATCGGGAKLLVNYATLGSDEGQSVGGDGSTTLTLSTQIGGEFLHIANSAYSFESDGATNQTEDIDCNKLVISVEFVVRLDRCPVLPLAQWTSLAGRVNSEAMPLFGETAVPGTVLFCGASSEKTLSIPDTSADETNVANSGLWSHELRFSLRCIDGVDQNDGVVTWNHLFRPKVGWDKIILDTGDNLYSEANLNELFLPPVPTQAEEEED